MALRKAFTMVEMMAVLVIIGILATIGYPMYQNFVSESKARVCEMNQKAIKYAIDIYAMDKGVIPGDLSLLDEGRLNKAYARVLEEEGISGRVALFAAELGKSRSAFALPPQQEFMYTLTKGQIKVMTCPLDDDPPPSGVSYGLNANLADLTYPAYKELKQKYPNTVILGDCNLNVFQSVEEIDTTRHSLTGTVFTGFDKSGFSILTTFLGTGKYYDDTKKFVSDFTYIDLSGYTPDKIISEFSQEFYNSISEPDSRDSHWSTGVFIDFVRYIDEYNAEELKQVDLNNDGIIGFGSETYYQEPAADRDHFNATTDTSVDASRALREYNLTD